MAAAYEAKRLPAVRLEQRISRNEARGAALGELKTLLQNLKDGVAGLRNPPGLLGANENVFETKQAFLSGGGAVPAGELVGVSVANRAAAGSFSLEVVRLATAHKLAAQPLGAVGQTLADAWNGGAAFAGHARDRPCRRRQGCDRRRRRHVRRRSARGDQRRLRADRRLGQRPVGLGDRSAPGAECHRDRPLHRAGRCRRRRGDGPTGAPRRCRRRRPRSFPSTACRSSARATASTTCCPA